MSEMSSEKDPYWQLKNGGGGMEGGGETAVPAPTTDANEFLPRKRLRSSGSYTDESLNSAETSPKKVKVQIDSSFELSEKVQNNHQDNNGESNLKTARVPSETVIDNTDVVKDALSDTTAAEQSNKSSVLSSKSEEFFRKSVKQQVEELAMEQGLETDYSFVKPHGYVYKIGQRAEAGDYEVCLSLAGEEGSCQDKFSGVGASPYEAIRAASKKAREFLTSENGVCLSPSKNLEEENGKKDSAGCTLGEEEADDDKVDEVNGTASQDVEKDLDVYSGDSEGNEEGDEEGQEQPKWVHSLENFWDKALASKFPTISVDYSDKDPEGEEDVVECSIGKLVVEGTGTTKEIARENAAQYMFSLIENILENEGTDTLKKNIIEGEDSEEAAPGYASGNQPPPFKDETAVETVEDEDNYDEDYDEEYEDDVQASKHSRKVVVEEEVIDSSSDESHPAPSPQKQTAPAQFSPPEQMLPGAEYCLALTRVDMPEERPMLVDVPNLARRTKARLAGQLVSSLREGELSDDEEQEGGRMLDIVQQLLTMASSMSDRHKQKVSEMFSRSGLGGVRPGLPMGGMPGMMAGMGYAQYQQMYQQQQQPGAGYPQYPSQKMRLLAGQAQPSPPQPEQPKPVQPLKNLCQFPMPGAIEGVGSVTVTLEDYKTLQVGTFLNDVIIDFYMKYLQFTQFSDQDKNGVHIFTTFWFSRLTNKPSPIEARKDPVQRRYDRVKRWTRKVNIFEKDFVVVPINENYHWYLCIICYPGMVGCKDMVTNTSCTTPAKQKKRKKAKDKIKGLKAKMNAKPRKDESDERDEPLASEDEVEHEDDSTDVELWKSKLSVWQREEVARKEEERRRTVELEKQRREWDQRRREYEEQQRKMYEEQQKMMEEEELRLAMEQEEMGDEEENWDEQEKYDEDGNPVEEKYDEYGELIVDKYNEFGEPIYDDAMEESEQHCENGGFADAAKYKSSAEVVTATDIPVKARAMAADWDDWGEDDDDEEDVQEEEAMDQGIALDDDVSTEEVANLYSSMVAHVSENYKSKNVTSTANQLVSTKVVVNITIAENVMETDGEADEHKYLSSMVAHTAAWNRVSQDCHTAAFAEKVEQDRAALLISDGSKDIPQMDGMGDDDGSDEEKVEEEKVEEEKVEEEKVEEEKDEEEKDEEEKDEKENDEESNPKKLGKVQNNSEASTDNIVTEDKVMSEKVASTEDEEAASSKGENGDPDESGMSTDDEVIIKNIGLVGYADTGDDTDTELDTDVEKGESVTNEDIKSPEVEVAVAEEISAESPSKAEQIEIALGDIENEAEEMEEKENSDVEMEVNSESSDTEDYDRDVNEKRIESNHDERHSDSEIEEVDVAEKESENEDKYEEDPSDRSESESEASESEEEDEDISTDVPVKQPCILVFDSLGGRKERQARLCATLRDFLALEFEEKYPGQKREFSTRTIPGAAPKVPQQPNLTDCGLFLCHNVETFFKKPIQDFTLPITELKTWFPDSESRMKRSNVATIIRKLGTQQNQDKLDQLQFPDLVFVEPEKVKPAQRVESRNSVGSDGENMDEYNSEDDYDEDDDEQRRSERYSSSPNAKKKIASREKDDRFSSEDFNSEDNEDRSEEEHDRPRDRNSHDDRRQKRSRSDDSGSDEDRKSRHQRRRNDRASSSDSGGSDDDFDSSAVYGRPAQKPTARPENNLKFDSSPMKKLPPGISISRSVEPNSRVPPQKHESTPQDQPEITRRLPPGISISRTLNNPPSGLTISRERSSPPTLGKQIPSVVRTTIVRDDDGLEDPNDVTIEDVSDCSDDCDIFDLDEPASKRTYLSPARVTPKKNQEEVADRLFRLPPGVSISRGVAKDEFEDMSESDGGDIEEMHDETMDIANDYYEDDHERVDVGIEDVFTPNNSISMVAHQGVLANIDPCLASMVAHQDVLANIDSCLASMVAHQDVHANIDPCLASMVAHQVFKEPDSVKQVPQLDGMDDVDSDDETNDSTVETVAVNQDMPDPPAEEQNDNEAPEMDQNQSIQDDKIVPAEVIDTNNEEERNAEVVSADDVDNIDNHGLEDGAEIFPAESGIAETHEDIKNGEEFKNDAFDDGSNLQNAEEIEEVDHADDVNLPTEEAMDAYDEEDTVEDEETVEGEEDVLDTSAEVIDDETEVIDGAEVLDDSNEVYEDDAEVLDNNQEEYDYEEGEDEEMYEEDNYSYGYSQPPIKRSRMSPEAEVVLDSGDEDDAPTPVYRAAQQNTSIHSQILAQQQAMLLAQQAQARPSYQAGRGLAQQQYSQPQQQHTQQHQPTTRKRKLESAALCIKDGQVYLKPFTQLPAALLGVKPHQNNLNPLHPNPRHMNQPKPNPLYTNPYHPMTAPGPSPYQPVLGVHQMTAQSYPRLPPKEDGLLHQRIRQLPPGIMVQRSEVREESRDSVEDDDEYQSDDPEEVIDGQEVDEDLDIIEDHSNKEVFSEEDESCDEVNGANEPDEAYEDENSKESSSDHEEILVTGNQEGQENKTSAEVDVEFEEASIDIQEACEENDKDDVEVENSPTEETDASEKQSDLIEGEEVADCDESQMDDGGEEAAE